MTAALHLTVTQHSPGRVEVAVFGPLHRRTVAELRRVLRDHRSSQVRIDLANCLDIDLDALRALAIARRIARTHGGDVLLCAAPPLIEDRCRRVHMDHLIEADDAEHQ